MTLGEELDELRKNILRDLSDRISGDSDNLWSDDSLLRYIKDGERRFARRTLCIRDGSTASITQIKLKAGVVEYPLHDSVMAVLSARYNTDAFDIQRSGHSLVSQFTPPEFLTYDPSTGFNVQPGRPIAFYTDETLVYAGSGKTTLSVYPVPSVLEEGMVLYLRVIRNTLTSYTVDSLDIESEIPEEYQLDCLEWAAYRALRNFDADAGASSPSEHHKTAFEEAVENAKIELKRKMFANTTFRYGTNGFNYTP
ncbi:MAG: phage adaptor protein [Bellilinea sp.]